MAFFVQRANVFLGQRVDVVHAVLEVGMRVTVVVLLRGDLHSERKKQRQDRKEGLWRHGRGGDSAAASWWA